MTDCVPLRQAGRPLSPVEMGNRLRQSLSRLYTPFGVNGYAAHVRLESREL